MGGQIDTKDKNMQLNGFNQIINLQTGKLQTFRNI